MASTTWLGTISTVGSNAANWSNGLPDVTKDVIFDGTAIRDFDMTSGFTNGQLVCLTLTMTGFTRTFTMGSQNTHSIKVAGNCTLSGSATWTDRPNMLINVASASITTNGVELSGLVFQNGFSPCTLTLNDDVIVYGTFEINSGSTLVQGTKTITMHLTTTQVSFQTVGTANITWSAGAKIIFYADHTFTEGEYYNGMPGIYVRTGLTLPPVEMHGTGTLWIANTDYQPGSPASSSGTGNVTMQSFTMDSGRVVTAYNIDASWYNGIQTVGNFTVSAGSFYQALYDINIDDFTESVGTPKNIVVGGNSSIAVTMNGTSVSTTTLAVTGTNAASGGVTITSINATVTALSASGCVNGGGNTNVTFGGGNPGAKSRGGAVGASGFGF